MRQLLVRTLQYRAKTNGIDADGFAYERLTGGTPVAKKIISIGAQDFEELRENDCFYIDKTYFINEWWDSKDKVTLITRPRRFGKTLNMSMLECFFSNRYKGRGDLFEGLSIWKDERYRAIQGTYPLIFMTFAEIKFRDYETTRKAINGLIADLYEEYKEYLDFDGLSESEKIRYNSVCEDMPDQTASRSISMLCGLLYRKWGRKCIVIIDEYDTPMLEAYLNGYWDDLVPYMRTLFGNTFKTNKYLERGIMTGITRISKESIFSDLNNLKVITTTASKYATAFGFTEEEVFRAMDDQGIDPAMKKDVKAWYDGFSFGGVSDIYNPWSITSFLDESKLGTYWADTSSNGLVGELLRTGDKEMKEAFEKLLMGESIEAEINEQVVFSDLDGNIGAAWGLLLAAGYLKAVNVTEPGFSGKAAYALKLTNHEVKLMFRDLIQRWFAGSTDLPDFIRCMLTGNIEDMNNYMNRIALDTFSSFDTGKGSSEKQPERFYHGFVLGLMVDKAKDYVIKSNKESGFGRYDVVMEPKDIKNTAVIMEFKVFDAKKEKSLSDTVTRALEQIEFRRYDADLLKRGIPTEHIYRYGFAFKGRECLIGMGQAMHEDGKNQIT